MSSPPWRDVSGTSCCRFIIKEAISIKLSPCMPGLGQGFCLFIWVTVRVTKPVSVTVKVTWK